MKLSFRNFDLFNIFFSSKQFMKLVNNCIKEQNASINNDGILKSYLSVKLFSKVILEFLYVLFP